MKDRESSWKKVWSVYYYFLRHIHGFRPQYIWLTIANVILQAILPFIDYMLLPLLINQLSGEKNITYIIVIISCTLVLDFIVGFFADFTGNQMEKAICAIDHYFQEMLSCKTMEMDFSLTENAHALAQLQKAKEGMENAGAGWTLSALKNTIINIIRVLGVMVLILANAPIMLFITTIATILAMGVNKYRNNLEMKYYRKRAEVNRRFAYVSKEVTDIRYGLDIRLYGGMAMLIDAVNDNICRLKIFYHEQSIRSARVAALDAFFAALRDVGNYFYLGVIALKGKISLGILCQLLSVTYTYTSSLWGIMFSMQELVKQANYADEYRRFMDYPSKVINGNAVIDNLSQGYRLEFKNVSFCYPGSNKKVLNNINLTIDSSEHISIVGLNGAGKTTFVKLLCRMYDPTEGQILLNGQDIREFNYDSYLSLFAPVFQDFKIFAFSTKENMTLVNKNKEINHEINMIKCLKMAGVFNKIENLPDGLDTPLQKIYEENGMVLSGGEQQKVAIARAVYKNAPFLILDEPTAALDPVSENEIYQRFYEITQGKTAIYISHRMSSCMFCHRIVVFSDGGIVESGTHSELYDKNGLYYRMWNAQAKYYVD